MNSYRLSSGTKALVGIAFALTLSTAYIHYWVGGLLLLVNAAGYLTLAIGVGVTAFIYRRALPLVLISLALYAAATIAGWLVMGPYFDVAYLAKAIEIGLITTIALTLRELRSETAMSIRWAMSLASRLVGRDSTPEPGFDHPTTAEQR